MTRLRYSSSAASRALQISNARVFIFVEGGLDRVFADRVLREGASGVHQLYQVRSIKEYSGTGGKPELLKLFKKLRRQSRLKGSAFGKPHYSIFLLDKDVDDLTRRLISSDHLVYTESYDLEGWLFLAGDVVNALAGACLLTAAQASALLGKKDEFTENATSAWAEWVALCIVSAKLKSNCGCTYDRVSTVNTPPLSVADATLVLDLKKNIAARTGLSLSQIERRYITARQHHFSAISSGAPFRYFKGKWLGHILEHHLRNQPKVPDSNTNGVFEKVLTALVGQITKDTVRDFSRDLVNKLKNAENYALTD